MMLQALPGTSSPRGPLFLPIPKGTFSHARREFRPTHYLGFVDPGEQSPIQSLSFVLHDLIGRSMVLTAPDDDSINFATVISLLRFGDSLRQGSRILVHCHHGRSRSTAAVAILVASTHGVAVAQDLLHRWQESRGLIQPNPRMLHVAGILMGSALHARPLPCESSDLLAPVHLRPCSSVAERILGKNEVARPIRVEGTN